MDARLSEIIYIGIRDAFSNAIGITMTILAHALIGAAIANKINNPYLACSVAFANHFICDAVPHWDMGTNWRSRSKAKTGSIAIIEVIFSFVLIYLLFSQIINSWLLLITVFSSVLPDFITAPYFIFYPKAPKIFYYLYKIQSKIHSRTSSYWGILTQIVTVAIFLILGFYFK